MCRSKREHLRREAKHITPLTLSLDKTSLLFVIAMARLLQRLAIIVGIAAAFFGYLYHVPDSAGVAQIDRIRFLSATMKIVNTVVRPFLSLLGASSLSFD